MFDNCTVLIRGGGDLASAVAQKLYRSGFRLIINELESPKMVRRTVSFSNAVYEKEYSVEGIVSRHVMNYNDVIRAFEEGVIPVTTLDEKDLIKFFKPKVFIDATLSKKTVNYHRGYTPIVIGLGPEIEAGVNADIVIETKRGHDLGRLIFDGYAEKNTSVAGNIEGFTEKRVLRAPTGGTIKTVKNIGDIVTKNDVIMTIDNKPVVAEIEGVVRGLIHSDVVAIENMKVGDVDPRGSKSHCYEISDKGRNIAGGVLEAILILKKQKNYKALCSYKQNK